MPEVCGHLVRDFLLFVPTADDIPRTLIAPTVHIGEVSDHKILSTCLTEVPNKVVKDARYHPNEDANKATIHPGREQEHPSADEDSHLVCFDSLSMECISPGYESVKNQ